MDFRTHLKKYLLDDQIEALIKSLENKEVKHALVLNDEKISVDSFKKEFPNIIPHPIVPNVFIYDSNEYSFGKHIYHEMGYYYIFEPCSSIVSHLLNPNENDIILDPFMGSGTTAKMAKKNNRNYIGFEISKEYCDIAEERLLNLMLDF